MRVVDLGLDGGTPEKVRVRAQGRSLLRLDRGGPAGVAGDLTPEAAEALQGAGAVLVADYGRGVAAGRGCGPRCRPSPAASPWSGTRTRAGPSRSRASRSSPPTARRPRTSLPATAVRR